MIDYVFKLKKLYSIIFFVFSLLKISVNAQTCPAVTVTDALGNQNAVISCNYPFVNGMCLKLNASFPLLRNTNNYKVATQNYTPVSTYNSGTQISLKDDEFSDLIPLPFSFCFYGAQYKSLVISSNGFITFDLSKAKNVSSPRVLGSLGTSNQNKLPTNSVYGVMQDLIFDNNASSGIFYQTIGTAPCRKFVITFYRGKMVGCEERATSQIVLNEGTNEIQVFVDKKPKVCSTIKFPESIIGILNAGSTAGIPAPNRNTGIWEASKEAYIFSPSGNPVTPTIEWYDDKGLSLGTGVSATVCPQEATFYKAVASYSNCGSELYKISDDFPITFGPDFPVAKDFSEVFCFAPPKNVNLDDYKPKVTPQNPANFNFKYYLTPQEAASGTTPSISNIQDLSGNSTFYVRIENVVQASCFRVAKLDFSFVSESLLTNNLQVCDAGNDGKELNYPLNIFDKKLFAENLGGTVTYFLNQNDANANTNDVKTADLFPATQLWVRYNISGCSTLFGPISLTFDAVPNVNTPVNITNTMCDINADFTEPFDYLSAVGTSITTDPTVTGIRFFATRNDAMEGLVANELYSIKEGVFTVFARVEFPNGCYTIAEVNVNSTFTKVEADYKVEYHCSTPGQIINVDLNALASTMLISPLDGSVTPYFYDNEYDAKSFTTNTINPNQTITVTPGMSSVVYYIRFHKAIDCYTLRTVEVKFADPLLKNSNAEVCDSMNDGSETITLSSFDQNFVGSPDTTATYFTDAAATSQIITLNVVGSASIFVKLNAHGCEKIFPITLSLIKTPKVLAAKSVSLIDVCNNNNSGQTVYDATQLVSQIYLGSDPADFSYYRSYDASTHTFFNEITDPQKMLISPNSQFFIKSGYTSGCFSVTKMDMNVTFQPAVILAPAVLYQCDLGFDANENYDLNDAIPQLFDQAANTINFKDLTKTFHTTEEDANNGVNAVSNLQTSVTPSDYFYVRFTTASGCYSVQSILLKSKYPPKALLTVINDVCDNNLDGTYDVDLIQHTTPLVQVQDPDNIFTFYETQGDAISGQNPISNPQDFHPNIGQRIWFRVQSVARCFDVNYIDFTMGNKPAVNQGPYVLDPCDSENDGIETLNLTQFENKMLSGATFSYYETLSQMTGGAVPIKNPSSYTFDKSKNSGKIFVKVEQAGFCPEKAEISVNLRKIPIIHLPEYYFCPYNGTVDIAPDFSGLEIGSYEWSSPSGQVISNADQLTGINTAGKYQLTLTGKNGCIFTTHFEVKKYEVPVIEKLIPNGNSFTVIATGSKTILYSINGKDWQTSNVFSNIPNGVTTFYVKFEDSTCLGLTKRGLMLNLSNAITPNGDGYNDVWKIENLDVFDGEKVHLQIFDRFGKMIFEQSSNTEIIWDGKDRGRPYPSTAYWYVLSLPDGRVLNNWILLKNRE